MKKFTPFYAIVLILFLIACGPSATPTQIVLTSTPIPIPPSETPAPTPTTVPPTDTPTPQPVVPLTYYYFVPLEEETPPEGSVVILEDELVLAPTQSTANGGPDTTENIKSALRTMLLDKRNAWTSTDMGITSITFDEGAVKVALDGDSFAPGDIVLIAARFQILLTVFSETSVQTALITFNGNNIANMGVSSMRFVQPDDYTYTRAVIESFITENAYQAP